MVVVVIFELTARFVIIGQCIYLTNIFCNPCVYIKPNKDAYMFVYQLLGNKFISREIEIPNKHIQRLTLWKDAVDNI